jgi:hypothetical protein
MCVCVYCNDAVVVVALVVVVSYNEGGCFFVSYIYLYIFNNYLILVAITVVDIFKL